jgi:hypothetical protein
MELDTERKGKLWDDTDNSLYYQQRTIAQSVGIEWKNNALRHTCISAWLGTGVGLNDVADRSGNSVYMIKKHYWSHISKTEANGWWDILPVDSTPEI